MLLCHDDYIVSRDVGGRLAPRGTIRQAECREVDRVGELGHGPDLVLRQGGGLCGGGDVGEARVVRPEVGRVLPVEAEVRVEEGDQRLIELVGIRLDLDRIGVGDLQGGRRLGACRTARQRGR